MPLNMVAYLGYKFFVFRTKGNFLSEWLKCFAVYGTGMIPRPWSRSRPHTASLQVGRSTITPLRFTPLVASLELHLSGKPLAIVYHVATGKSMAGYIAGAIFMGVSTIYSFIGHKKVTFRQKPASKEVPQ